jgi:hypothetical protein
VRRAFSKAVRAAFDAQTGFNADVDDVDGDGDGDIDCGETKKKAAAPERCKLLQGTFALFVQVR